MASFYYFPDLSNGSLCSPFLLALSFFFSPFFLLSLRVRTCTRSTAPRASPAPSRASTDGGGYRGGVERSAVVVFVPRRRVCLETRGKHEWALPGLHLRFLIEYARVYKVRSVLQDNIQGVFIFATGLEAQRERYAV